MKANIYFNNKFYVSLSESSIFVSSQQSGQFNQYIVYSK